MNTCKALVWDGITDDGRCGREATIELEKRWFCSRCALVHVNGNLDYSLHYLATISSKVSELDVDIFPDKHLELFLLRNAIDSAIELINKIKTDI
jgi:hypothetical protein